MKRTCTHLLFLFAFASSSAYAQQLSLSEAFNTALKQNLDIQIEKNNASIAEIANHTGMAGGLPVVNASVSDQESRIAVNQKLSTGMEIDRKGILSNNLNGNVTAGWLLFNGNRVNATKKRLETIQQQSQQLLNAQIQNILAAVTVKYFEVVRQQSLLKTLRQSRVLSQQQYDIANTRKGVGMASESDVLQSLIDLNTRDQDIKSQEVIITQTKADLFNLLHLPASSDFIINDTIGIDEHILLNDVLNGIQNNPEIMVLDQQIKVNEYLEKEASALRKPSLNSLAGINYGKSKSEAGQLLLNQTYGPFIGLGLTIPIYNGGNNKRQEAMAAIRTKTALLQKENLLSNYNIAANKVFQSYLNGQEQLKTHKQIVEMSKKLAEITLQRFQLASATIIEVREAQKSFEEASYRVVNLLYMTKLAETELKRLSNKISL